MARRSAISVSVMPVPTLSSIHSAVAAQEGVVRLFPPRIVVGERLKPLGHRLERRRPPSCAWSRRSPRCASPAIHQIGAHHRQDGEEDARDEVERDAAGDRFHSIIVPQHTQIGRSDHTTEARFRLRLITLVNMAKHTLSIAATVGWADGASRESAGRVQFACRGLSSRRNTRIAGLQTARRPTRAGKCSLIDKLLM